MTDTILQDAIEEGLSLVALQLHLKRQHKIEVAGAWALVGRVEAENMHHLAHAEPLRSVK